MWFAPCSESLAGGISEGQDETREGRSLKCEQQKERTEQSSAQIGFAEGELWAAVILLFVWCLAFKCRSWGSISALFVCWFPSPCM